MDARVAAASFLALAVVIGPGDPLIFQRAIPMPQIEGRIDHLAFDTSSRRLLVAALGNNTVEVLDTRAGTAMKSLAGFHEPQGIGQPLDADVVAIANGGTGDLVMLDRATFRIVRRVPLGEDADNVRFDRKTRRFYVGFGSGAIAAVSEGGERLGEVKLPAHPESLQLESDGPRLFVNLPGARSIAVVDRAAMKVEANWPVTSAEANYPMALDEAGHRLFIGCRRPAVVLVYDTRTGKQTASVPIVGDTDDMFYDGRRQRLYVIGGAGFVDVFQSGAGGRLDRDARVATAAGARTGLFVPEEDRLYVAVPHRGPQQAEIRVFETR